MRTTLIALLLASTAAADDWAHFQGPRGNGTSPEKNLLREWPVEGPPVLWKAKIRMGWSSPSISKGEVFIAWSEQSNGTAETVACLDAATGTEKWKYSYDVGPYWKRNIGWAAGGFRSTPAVDDRHVFTLGAIGHLHCLDRKTGAVVWKTNLWDEMFPSGEKGYSFSPLLADGKLILYYGDGTHPVAEEKKEFFVHCRALDPETGKVAWSFTEPHLAGAMMGEGQTPAIARIGGKLCALFMGNLSLIALAVDDGAVVWRFQCLGREGRGTTMPTPLVLDHTIINLPDFEYGHAVSYDPERADVPGKFVWNKSLRVNTAIHQFRPSGDFLYGFTGKLEGDSAMHASNCVMDLVCVETATGTVKWKQPGFRQGISITEADGLLFLRCYQTLRLVEATPEGYRQRGEIKIHDNRQPTINLVDLVMPVLSEGRLYVRIPDELICFRVSK